MLLTWKTITLSVFPVKTAGLFKIACYALLLPILGFLYFFFKTD